MGVRGVGGREFHALAAPASAHAPRLTSPDNDEATGTGPPARAGPEASKLQDKPTPRAKASRKSPVAQRGDTRLHIDSPSKRIVTQILDHNNEVIKQIPPEELLKIAARFRDLRGVLFDENA